MAKNITKTAKAVADKVARDVAAELLGDGDVLLGSPAKMAAARAELAAAKASNRAGKGKRGKAGKVAAGSAKTSGKAGKANGTATIGRPSQYTDDQKIVVVDARKGRGQTQKVWDMVEKSKTIAQYKALREKAGLNGIGGLLAMFVKAGNIKVK